MWFCSMFIFLDKINTKRLFLLVDKSTPIDNYLLNRIKTICSIFVYHFVWFSGKAKQQVVPRQSNFPSRPVMARAKNKTRRRTPEIVACGDMYVCVFRSCVNVAEKRLIIKTK